MGIMNDLISKAKGKIEVVNHNTFKGVKQVFRDGIEIFNYTINSGIYNIMPCKEHFYYTSTIQMDETKFNKFMNYITL